MRIDACAWQRLARHEIVENAVDLDRADGDGGCHSRFLFVWAELLQSIISNAGYSIGGRRPEPIIFRTCATLTDSYDALQYVWVLAGR
jgi:hypothetical protein